MYIRVCVCVGFSTGICTGGLASTACRRLFMVPDIRHKNGVSPPSRRCGVVSECYSSMYATSAVEDDKHSPTDIEDIIPVESVQLIAKQLLESEQFFRLTIDLKKLKFVEPLQTRVIEDDEFVNSVSLSYLTAPLFQSSDVFHAIQIARNAKDPSELLISDGFCSFRFEDRLLWTDFARLFLPSAQESANPNQPVASGAALPIFVRALRLKRNLPQLESPR
eukprot:Gregarina_sp_Poly_1__769@NODE_1184_length_4843_cov_219_562814_g814_i0_p4_GENE_NODE_1184_length_4843_cov_219_562814_g814_i0NODE_1184_length_4843_cov_219_562814_g814_i0_p4_ORF_typecomplete_len221_score19_05_NODE_1184_length_4843_cov_219_562814_g814_i013161978